jgi:hypothetical protein
MRFFAASILLIALLVQNCSRYLIILDYQLNKDYIAKNLCENRNKPKCCCCGKCFLKKQLDKNDKEQGTSGNTSQRDKDEVLFFTAEKSVLFIRNGIIIKKDYTFNKTSFTLQNPYSSVFHPPQV